VDIFVELLKTGEVFRARVKGNGDALVMVNKQWRELTASNFERKYKQVEQEKPLPVVQKIAVKRHVAKPLVVKPMPKPQMVRADEKYFADVRKLPCQFQGCGRQGPSEASHRNTGKGTGIKAHDLLAALCREHHTMIDQRINMSHKDAEYEWLNAYYNTNVSLIKQSEQEWKI
jgi:hypothetical protein